MIQWTLNLTRQIHFWPTTSSFLSDIPLLVCFSPQQNSQTLGFFDLSFTVFILSVFHQPELHQRGMKRLWGTSACYRCIWLQPSMVTLTKWVTPVHPQHYLTCLLLYWGGWLVFCLIICVCFIRASRKQRGVSWDTSWGPTKWTDRGERRWGGK